MNVDKINVLYYYKYKNVWKRFQLLWKREMNSLGIIVCQKCERTIDHFEEEKVTTLYANCNSCLSESDKKITKRRVY